MMTTEITEQPKRQLTIREQLQGDGFRAAIAEILPKHVTAERMARVAIAALGRTPSLAKCTQQSFFDCMMQLSQWGLEPDGRHAHLIPYGDKCTLIIDYKGFVQLMMRTGKVSRIHADKVCVNDEFVYDLGEVKVHRPLLIGDRGPVYAYYCLIEMQDGSKKCEVMTLDEVLAIRDRSAGYKVAIRDKKTHPWITDQDEMGKKTVYKRASKWCELSADVRDAIAADDEIEGRVTHRGPTTTTADELAGLLGGSEE
jgi:recombination protein RecT